MKNQINLLKPKINRDDRRYFRHLYSDNEQFMFIPGYEGIYLISNKTRILSMHKGRKLFKFLTPVLNKNRGYMYVSLEKNRKRINWKLHRLVALTFLKNPKKLPEVNHIDGNKLNNLPQNLEWIDSQGNKDHAVKHGLTVHLRGELSGNSKLTADQVREIKRMKVVNPKTRNKDIAKLFGIGESTVTHIILGTRWAHIK